MGREWVHDYTEDQIQEKDCGHYFGEDWGEALRQEAVLDSKLCDVQSLGEEDVGAELLPVNRWESGAFPAVRLLKGVKCTFVFISIFVHP